MAVTLAHKTTLRCRDGTPSFEASVRTLSSRTPCSTCTRQMHVSPLLHVVLGFLWTTAIRNIGTCSAPLVPRWDLLRSCGQRGWVRFEGKGRAKGEGEARILTQITMCRREHPKGCRVLLRYTQDTVGGAHSPITIPTPANSRLHFQDMLRSPQPSMYHSYCYTALGATSPLIHAQCSC